MVFTSGQEAWGSPPYLTSVFVLVLVARRDWGADFPLPDRVLDEKLSPSMPVCVRSSASLVDVMRGLTARKVEPVCACVCVCMFA